MNTFFDLLILNGHRFRGWMDRKSIDGGFITIIRRDDTVVCVQLTQIAYLEELPEGHPRIPAWGVDQLAQVQV